MTDQQHPPQDEEIQEAETPEGAPDIGGRALSDAFRLSFRFLKLAMIFFIAFYVLQGVFFLERDEIAIKLSFGRPVEVNLGSGRGQSYVIDAESGWHIRWPWEEVIRISLGQKTLQLDKEFWLKETGEGEQEAPPPEAEGPDAPGLKLTETGYLIAGDVNLVHMKLRARYHALRTEHGALDYAFRCRDTERVLERMLIACAIETVGSWSVMEVLTKTKDYPGEAEDAPVVRASLSEEIERRLDVKLKEFKERNGYSLGIRLTAVELMETQKQANPLMPSRVRKAFEQATEAESEKDKIISEARERQKRIIADAEGRSAEIIAGANAYKERLARVAAADAETLAKLMAAYDKSPEMACILRERHYERVMEKLLGEAEGSFIVHRPTEGGVREMRFLLAPPRAKSKKKQEHTGPGHP